MKKIFLILLLTSLKVGAQQNTYNALIEYQMPLINPAHAGAEAQQSFFLNTRNQWAAVEDSPKTLSMAYSIARNNNVGVGISIISDQLFIEKQTAVGIDFSYKLTLNNDALLFLGIKGGFNSFRADTQQLIAYGEGNDPAKRDLSRVNPNIGVGFLFKQQKTWVSAALPRLFNAKRSEEINLSARDRIHLYLAAGTAFSMNENIQLEPKMIYRNAEGIKAVVEGVIWGNYKNKFRLGLGRRTGAVTSLKMKLELNENISLSYAYDTYGAMNTIINQFSAHEIGLRLQLNSTASSEIATNDTQESEE